MASAVKSPVFECKFDNKETIQADPRISIMGSYRLLEINGKVGYYGVNPRTVCKIKTGAHIRCAINNVLVLDAYGNHDTKSGADLNYRRIGLRQMFQTRMRYSNLKVWSKNVEVKIVHEQNQSLADRLIFSTPDLTKSIL